MKKSITQIVIDLYASFFKRFRTLILLLVILLTIGSAYGLTRITLEDDFIQLLVPRHLSAAAEKTDIGARSDRGLLVMLSSDNLFTPEALEVIENTSERLREIEGVTGVISLYDLRKPRRIGRRTMFLRIVPPPDADPERIEKARQEVMTHPMSQGQLISPDGKETLLILEVDPTFRTTAQIGPIVEKIGRVIREATEGSTVTGMVTGVPAIRVEMARAMFRDQVIFNVAGPLVAMVIAFVVFRRVASVFIVLTGAGLGVIWTLGTLGLLGIPINPVNAVIAPLALTIGLTDSVHMLMHIRDHRANGSSALEAAVESIRRVGFPSALTSLTSAVGFASLGIAKLHVLAEFGFCAALSVVLAFISVMTLVPLLGSSAIGRFIQLPVSVNTKKANHVKWHTYLVTFVVDHKVAFLLLSLLVTGGAFHLAAQIEVDPRVANGMPTTGAARAAYTSIDEKFGGALPMAVVVHWDDVEAPTAANIYEAIHDAHNVLANEQVLGPPLSLVNFYQSLPEKDQTPTSMFRHLTKIPREQLNNVVDLEKRQAVVMARCRDAGGMPVYQMLNSVENKLQELESRHPGYHFEVPILAVTGIANSTFVIQDLAQSLLMAVPMTLGTLMLALKSFKVGIIALLPNVFPMVALAATIVATGQAITLTGAAVFVMCFGIAVDDTIHAMTSFNRRFHAGQSVREAVIDAYRELGDAVISTTIILIGGLSVVMLGQSYMTRSFGIVFCIGLFWAVLGDLIILPAAIACWPHRRNKEANLEKEVL